MNHYLHNFESAVCVHDFVEHHRRIIKSRITTHHESTIVFYLSSSAGVFAFFILRACIFGIKSVNAALINWWRWSNRFPSKSSETTYTWNELPHLQKYTIDQLHWRYPSIYCLFYYSSIVALDNERGKCWEAARKQYHSIRHPPSGYIIYPYFFNGNRRFNRALYVRNSQNAHTWIDE